MNIIRMKYIIDVLGDSSKPDSLNEVSALDVGCGGGLLSESLARLGANVTAIDPSKELVAQAVRHGQLDPRTRSIDYRGGYSVEMLADESNSKFDVICLLEVLEHATDPISILSSIRRLLKPNGKLFISTLNRTVKSQLVAIVGAEYVMRYLPVGTHNWNEFRSPREVEALINDAGLVQLDMTGMVLTSPPLGGNWNWTLDPNDTDINWIGAYELRRGKEVPVPF